MNSLEQLMSGRAASRLRSHDTSLFTEDPQIADLVDERLGWTTLSHAAIKLAPELSALVRALADEGVTDVALLGMGGSSLAALVMASVFGTRTGSMRLHVVDTTSPITIRRLRTELDPKKTAFLMASKSGSTVEPNTLYAIFRLWSDTALGREAGGKRFIAITDPGSSLEALAQTDGFRATVTAPPDVGGRYSALTAFGLVPAALIGIDLAEFIGRARAIETACAADSAANPALALAAFIGDAKAAGRDKLTVVASDTLATFGLWVEQLVAESTGKHGTGIIPIVELSDEPLGYREDRAVVVVRFAEDAITAGLADRLRAYAPVFECVLDDRFDLAAEFVRWETAVALVGRLLSINPFDEPDVWTAKRATVEVLEGRTEPIAHLAEVGDVRITASGIELGQDVASLADVLQTAIHALADRDYLALLAFLPDDDLLLEPLRSVVPKIAATTGRAVCFELGPRYLHSTGQLHKGGPNEGVFVMVSARDSADVDVPGKEYTLGRLHRAQAEGDFATLQSTGRRVVRIDLPDSSAYSLQTLVDALELDVLTQA